MTGKRITTGATPRVPLNTALRPRPVGPAVHTDQKLSPQLTCKNTRLVVGVRNRNLVASFWVGREVTWVGQQRGDVLTSGIASLSFHHRHTPSHFIFLGSRPRHNFQIGILRLFNCKFYPVKVLRSSNEDCHIVGCTKWPIPPTRQESLF